MSDGKIIGDLYLGKYDKEDSEEREDKLWTFLKERGW